MSTVVANVLNAQNAVASCIRGIGVISAGISPIVGEFDGLI
jgi:hypothetical protein